LIIVDFNAPTNSQLVALSKNDRGQRQSNPRAEDWLQVYTHVIGAADQTECAGKPEAEIPVQIIVTE
jgi:hypothetical protein